MCQPHHEDLGQSHVVLTSLSAGGDAYCAKVELARREKEEQLATFRQELEQQQIAKQKKWAQILEEVKAERDMKHKELQSELHVRFWPTTTTYMTCSCNPYGLQ